MIFNVIKAMLVSHIQVLFFRGSNEIFFVRDFCHINSHEESGTINICGEETKSNFNIYKQNSRSNFKLFMSKLPYMVPYNIQKRG